MFLSIFKMTKHQIFLLKDIKTISSLSFQQMRFFNVPDSFIFVEIFELRFNPQLFAFCQFRSHPARFTGPSLCPPPRATKAQPAQSRPREVPRTAWPPDATPSRATRTALWAPVGQPIP